MSSLLSRAGYDPLGVDSIEAGKVEAAKLPSGAVIVTAMRLSDGTARESFLEPYGEKSTG
ncbi:hypothetical protein [uncultured Duncaniella sp.]|uniref:hypothetical protein n=1 Tax=uncultured Duncaniella sp. TaxID=2768039 RepID=UPI0026295FA4|nr:hypothetical protein [uncultured Duncaniella sp.]